MSASPTPSPTDREPGSAGAAGDGAGDGVWLTDREPGELLGPRRIVVYLRDSDPIVVGEADSRPDAVAIAERVVETIERADSRAEWAELADRFVRPDAIVSIDIELVE